MPTIGPYGSWASPIGADMLATAQVVPNQLAAENGTVYWDELRPGEGGRYVLLSANHGELLEWTPPGFDVRTRVHEYGGGAFWVHSGTAYFCNFGDQRIYRQDSPDAEPEPITEPPPRPASVRYADGEVTPDGKWILCVRETHSEAEVTNEVVAVANDGSGVQNVLATGADFYSFPRLSPDGSRLAYTAWDHPNMPWDGTRLLVVHFDDGLAGGEARPVAGGEDESIYQPAWDPGGILHFVSDRTNWWNIYAERDGETACLCAIEAEFGSPQWVFNGSNYDFLDDGRIVTVWSSEGIDHIGVLEDGELTEIETPFTTFRYPQVRAEGNMVAVKAGGPTEAAGVRLISIDPAGIQTVRRGASPDIDRGYVSEAIPIEFPTDGGLTAHALFYRPKNEGFEAPEGELPPLLVKSHGGPTSQVSPQLDLEIQFATSRGFAVVDVNYGGSTGYGREYRERLKGMWGVVDVADCLNAARHLVERGEADGARVAVRGGSAGGYTTLSSLAFTDFYAAGASYYGVGDLAALAADTHKFESRYLDGLVGPYPEAADLYRERSAVAHAGQVSCPVILFQGLEDPVVPPAQAERFVAALEEAGLPWAYLAFEGEQHGFRKAATIRRCAEAELYFYSKVFGFMPADDLEPVDINNLGRK